MGEIRIGGGMCETLLATQLTVKQYKHRQEFLKMNTWERVKSHQKSIPKCECGAIMIMREGKYGKFWGCSKYPKCTNTKQLK